MNSLTLLAEARQGIGCNRLRTGLSLFSMAIGVGAVVLMLAIGQGVQYLVNRDIAALGSHMLVVLTAAPTANNGLRLTAGSRATLTTGDGQALAELPAVARVAPFVSQEAQLAHASDNWNSFVSGTTPSYLDLRAWPLARGQSFTEADARAAAQVVLLGHTVARELFGEDDPVGSSVRIKHYPFRVVGVLAPRGQTLDGRDQDDTALVPVTTAQRKLFGNPFPDRVRLILVQARSAAVMDRAQQEITLLLRQRHRIKAHQNDDFSVRNLSAVVQTAATSARELSFMLGAIASISLLVGGIGIMNIMLVSVTERTREIGIRMAIGARPRDILLHFLLEAVMTSLLGGLAGISAGVASAWAVSYLSDRTVVLTIGNLASASLVAAGIGMFFGLYPAHRAARLTPIEALRHS